MITAIPMTETWISGHFSRADHFVFLDERGAVLAQHANPALDDACSGKEALLALLRANKTDRIVVRNVGQQMLGKLLERQFKVFRLGRESTGVLDLVDPHARHLTPLTEAGQGRVSLRHEEKKKEGGCGCHHHETAHDAHAGCCQQQKKDENHPHPHTCGHRKRCCHRQGEETSEPRR